MYGCQQVLISPDNELKAVIEFICQQANSLTNCGIYYARQLYLKTQRLVGKYDLETEYKTHRHFKALYSQTAQQILRSVYESFQSFKKLKQAFRQGKIVDKPKAPKYRKSGGFAFVTYIKQALRLSGNQIRIPLGRQVKCWFGANSVGTLVFGWNQRNKDGIELGKKNNQEFVQIPTAKLKTRISQLCKQYGIQFVETEESYTSKASYLDDDFLPTYGEKPNEWKASGKRGAKKRGVIHNLGRGGYQTQLGVRINSDCNGAANILKKVATQLGLNLVKVSRAVLTLPQRYDLFQGLSRKYRERCYSV